MSTDEQRELATAEPETTEVQRPEGPNGDSVTHRDLSEWRGHELYDSVGKKIGRLEEVYFDVDTDEPQFGTVRRGWLTKRLEFVPLVGAVVGPDNLQLATTLDQVKAAPDLGKGELTPAAESALFHHYRINYSPSSRDSQRRLVRH
jgi:hypothetical protein